jgi:hypothetical protein
VNPGNFIMGTPDYGNRQSGCHWKCCLGTYVGPIVGNGVGNVIGNVSGSHGAEQF